MELEEQVAGCHEEAALEPAVLVGQQAQGPLLGEGQRVGVVAVHQPDQREVDEDADGPGALQEGRPLLLPPLRELLLPGLPLRPAALTLLLQPRSQLLHLLVDLDELALQLGVLREGGGRVELLEAALDLGLPAREGLDFWVDGRAVGLFGGVCEPAEAVAVGPADDELLDEADQDGDYLHHDRGDYMIVGVGLVISDLVLELLAGVGLAVEGRARLHRLLRAAVVALLDELVGQQSAVLLDAELEGEVERCACDGEGQQEPEHDHLRGVGGGGLRLAAAADVAQLDRLVDEPQPVRVLLAPRRGLDLHLGLCAHEVHLLLPRDPADLAQLNSPSRTSTATSTASSLMSASAAVAVKTEPSRQLANWATLVLESARKRRYCTRTASMDWVCCQSTATGRKRKSTAVPVKAQVMSRSARSMSLQGGGSLGSQQWYLMRQPSSASLRGSTLTKYSPKTCPALMTKCPPQLLCSSTTSLSLALLPERLLQLRLAATRRSPQQVNTSIIAALLAEYSSNSPARNSTAEAEGARCTSDCFTSVMLLLTARSKASEMQQVPRFSGSSRLKTALSDSRSEEMGRSTASPPSVLSKAAEAVSAGASGAGSARPTSRSSELERWSGEARLRNSRRAVWLGAKSQQKGTPSKMREVTACLETLMAQLLWARAVTAIWQRVKQELQSLEKASVWLLWGTRKVCALLMVAFTTTFLPGSRTSTPSRPQIGEKLMLKAEIELNVQLRTAPAPSFSFTIPLTLRGTLLPSPATMTSAIAASALTTATTYWQFQQNPSALLSTTNSPPSFPAKGKPAGSLASSCARVALAAGAAKSERVPVLTIWTILKEELRVCVQSRYILPADCRSKAYFLPSAATTSGKSTRVQVTSQLQRPCAPSTQRLSSELPRLMRASPLERRSGASLDSEERLAAKQSSWLLDSLPRSLMETRASLSALDSSWQLYISSLSRQPTLESPRKRRVSVWLTSISKEEREWASQYQGKTEMARTHSSQYWSMVSELMVKMLVQVPQTMASKKLSWKSCWVSQLVSRQGRQRAEALPRNSASSTKCSARQQALLLSEVKNSLMAESSQTQQQKYLPLWCDRSGLLTRSTIPSNSPTSRPPSSAITEKLTAEEHAKRIFTSQATLELPLRKLQKEESSCFVTAWWCEAAGQRQCSLRQTVIVRDWSSSRERGTLEVTSSSTALASEQTTQPCSPRCSSRQSGRLSEQARQALWRRKRMTNFCTSSAFPRTTARQVCPPMVPQLQVALLLERLWLLHSTVFFALSLSSRVTAPASIITYSVMLLDWSVLTRKVAVLSPSLRVYSCERSMLMASSVSLRLRAVVLLVRLSLRTTLTPRENSESWMPQTATQMVWASSLLRKVRKLPTEKKRFLPSDSSVGNSSTVEAMRQRSPSMTVEQKVRESTPSRAGRRKRQKRYSCLRTTSRASCPSRRVAWYWRLLRASVQWAVRLASSMATTWKEQQWASEPLSALHCEASTWNTRQQYRSLFFSVSSISWKLPSTAPSCSSARSPITQSSTDSLLSAGLQRRMPNLSLPVMTSTLREQLRRVFWPVQAVSSKKQLQSCPGCSSLQTSMSGCRLVQLSACSCEQSRQSAVQQEVTRMKIAPVKFSCLRMAYVIWKVVAATELRSLKEFRKLLSIAMSTQGLPLQTTRPMDTVRPAIALASLPRSSLQTLLWEQEVKSKQDLPSSTRKELPLSTLENSFTRMPGDSYRQSLIQSPAPTSSRDRNTPFPPQKMLSPLRSNCALFGRSRLLFPTFANISRPSLAFSMLSICAQSASCVKLRLGGTCISISSKSGSPGVAAKVVVSLRASRSTGERKGRRSRRHSTKQQTSAVREELGVRRSAGMLQTPLNSSLELQQLQKVPCPAQMSMKGFCRGSLGHWARKKNSLLAGSSPGSCTSKKQVLSGCRVTAKSCQSARLVAFCARRAGRRRRSARRALMDIQIK